MARKYERIFAINLPAPIDNLNDEAEPPVDIQFTVITSFPAAGLPEANAALVLEDLQQEVAHYSSQVLSY
ncbi:hypothetical protein BGX26_011210 [Mortierella sp. AD094]|nr:hypothetical protein BGX26_011210 [Mortierella sp. AD094]